MKKEVFNKYVNVLCKMFGITKEELFSNNKRSDVSTARQMLYYLCYDRQMRIIDIQRYMIESGYDPRHTPIIRGIKSATVKIETDKDYQEVISRIQSSIFI